MRLRSLALILALGLAVAPSAMADTTAVKKPPSDQEEARAALQRHEILPLARILAITAKAAPGDVIKVKIERKHGVLMYELKVLAPSGRVLEVQIDARTGAVLKVEDD